MLSILSIMHWYVATCLSLFSLRFFSFRHPDSLWSSLLAATIKFLCMGRCARAKCPKSRSLLMSLAIFREGNQCLFFPLFFVTFFFCLCVLILSILEIEACRLCAQEPWLSLITRCIKQLLPTTLAEECAC